MSISFEHKTKEEILKVLKTSFNGLSSNEAEKRLSSYGANAIKINKKLIFMKRLGKKFIDPISLILLFAIAFTFLAELYTDTYIILALYIITILIGFTQEGRSNKAFEKLNKEEKKTCIVLRDGQKIIIDISEIVPGDVIILKTGSYIPADIRILEESNLSVDESTLTGEWAPVIKNSNNIIGETQLADRSNMLWRGTLVVNGKCRGVVLTTGEETKLGGYSKYLKIDTVETPLQKSIKRLAGFILILVLIAICGIFLLGILSGFPLIDVIFTSTSVAIAAIPTGISATVAFILAVGMKHILDKGGLVRNLLAAETLGATTWILTDKTGTLTKGNIKLKSVITSYNKKLKIEEGGDELERIIKTAVLSTDSVFVKEGDEIQIGGSSIDKGIGEVAFELGIDRNILDIDNKRLDYLPFSSEKRISASINEDKNNFSNLMYVTGSPEKILNYSSKYIKESGLLSELTETQKSKIKMDIWNETELGKRVIAIGYKETEKNEFDDERFVDDLDSNLEDLVFTSILIFEDEIRDGVKESIEFIKNSNVSVTMVTGDNRNTALYIAKEVGIYNEGSKIVEGSQFSKFSDEEILKLARDKAIFARMLPDQKLRLLTILEEKNEVVAMTGDGVNDAPTLQNASIGIAVSSGTEVAKEASDLILIKNSFSTITKAIVEGRRIIANIRKIVIYLLSTSFSEVFLIGGALILALPLPLLPAQILWANLVEELFMSFGFAFEKEETNLKNENAVNKRENYIMTEGVYRAIFVMSIASGLFLLGLYVLLMNYSNFEIDQVRTIIFAALSIDSIFFALSLKRLNVGFFRINFFDNLYLLGSVFLSFSLFLAAIYVPFLRDALNLTTPPIETLWIVIVSAIYHISVVEYIKISSFKDETVIK